MTTFASTGPPGPDARGAPVRERCRGRIAAGPEVDGEPAERARGLVGHRLRFPLSPALDRDAGPFMLARPRYSRGVSRPGRGAAEAAITARGRRDDARPDEVDPGFDVVRGDAQDRRAAAPASASVPEVIDERRRRYGAGGAVARRPGHVLERGSARSRRTVAPSLVAPFAQDGVLVGDLLRPPEDVARVGVPGDEPERLLLAAAADQDRWARPAQRLRGVEESRRAGTGAPSNGASVPRSPVHIPCAIRRVSSSISNRSAERREREPEPGRLLLVPRRADAEPCRDRRKGRRASSQPSPRAPGSR